MRISIAQLNYHIGNFTKNKELICNAIGKARAEGSDLVIFSELSVPGYPPLDLLDHYDFVEKCNATVLEIAKSVSVLQQSLVLLQLTGIKKGRSFTIQHCCSLRVNNFHCQ